MSFVTVPRAAIDALNAERERLHHALAEARAIVDNSARNLRTPVPMARAVRDRIDAIMAKETRQ